MTPVENLLPTGQISRSFNSKHKSNLACFVESYCNLLTVVFMMSAPFSLVLMTREEV